MMVLLAIYYNLHNICDLIDIHTFCRIPFLASFSYCEAIVTKSEMSIKTCSVNAPKSTLPEHVWRHLRGKYV